MIIKKVIFTLLGLSVLLGNSIAQDCDGSLSVSLDGSATAKPISVIINTNHISCLSDVNGSIALETFGGNPNYDYAWGDVISSDSIREDLEAGTYFVTITDAIGCSKEIIQTVTNLSPNNTDLSMDDGCGVCSLEDGENTYFFTESRDYIAALTDTSGDGMGLGDTEVCLYKDNAIQYCDGNPYLQRQWSVNPGSQENACLKLFFTKGELENLAGAVSGESLTAQDLIDNDRICITAFVGGMESCSDYQSATIYSTADSPGLVITEEDPVEEIWSVSVCTDEFATFYMHVCDYSLPVELLYFTGRKEDGNNRLNWETASEVNTSHFELEKATGNGQFTFLAKIDAQGYSNEPQTYSYLDRAPSTLDYYRLKIIDFDGSYTYSQVVVLQSDQNIVSKFYPSPFIDEAYFETSLSSADQLDLVIYDVLGRTAFRQQYKLKSGFHKLPLKLDHLVKGHYFVQVVSKNTETIEAFKVVKK